MGHPYLKLPKTAFWKTAIAEPEPLEIGGLWQPKYRVRPHHKIVTAGSCFAQHIGRALDDNGYVWMDAEPAPEFLSEQDQREFNYGVFSFRTGNIYTPNMLLQWLKLAFDAGDVDGAGEIWQQEDRYYDPLRPAIEPNGFASPQELSMSRQATLGAIRRAVSEASVFVFTLGLTESWRNKATGLEYAMCPGTIAGEYDAEKHEFHNHNFGETLRYMRRALAILRGQSGRIRVLLTVSPVPLTATATGQHVLTATTYSKSVLRSVAGQLADEKRFVDYFPSFEIITGHPFAARFYDSNQRNVLPEGVSFVMQSFFADQAAKFGEPTKKTQLRRQAKKKQKDAESTPSDDVVCEEEMLNAFA